MVAKKKATKKASRKAVRASSASATRGRALKGQAPRGRAWDPSKPATMSRARAMAASVELNEPRPYKTRYPIPDEKFKALKEGAPKAKLARPTAARVKDSGKKRIEVSARGIAAAPVLPGLAPSAAPMPSGNFAGISATGWLPLTVN